MELPYCSHLKIKSLGLSLQNLKEGFSFCTCQGSPRNSDLLKDSAYYSKAFLGGFWLGMIKWEKKILASVNEIQTKIVC